MDFTTRPGSLLLWHFLSLKCALIGKDHHALTSRRNMTVYSPCKKGVAKRPPARTELMEPENVEITIAGSPHRVIEGQLILMPANQPHALKALKRFKMILTMIRS